MHKYEKPEFEKIRINNEDIITASAAEPSVQSFTLDFQHDLNKDDGKYVY